MVANSFPLGTRVRWGARFSSLQKTALFETFTSFKAAEVIAHTPQGGFGSTRILCPEIKANAIGNIERVKQPILKTFEPMIMLLRIDKSIAILHIHVEWRLVA